VSGDELEQPVTVAYATTKLTAIASSVGPQPTPVEISS
jgi:hypothetical protein